MTVFKKISEATGISIDRLEEFGHNLAFHKNAIPPFIEGEEYESMRNGWTKVREWCNSQYPGVEAWAVILSGYRGFGE